MPTIRNNLSASYAHRQLKKTGIAQRRASNRLASGFRINSAADDAAGLAISEKIRGLDQGERNTQDGISLIQTAEGALSTINDMVIRLRELVIQASNDTNTLEDRQQIQREIDEIIDEIDATAHRTQFNTRVLLSGNYSKEAFEGVSMAGFNVDFTPFSDALPQPSWWNMRAPWAGAGNMPIEWPEHTYGQTPHDSLQHAFTRIMSPVNSPQLGDAMNNFAVSRGFANFTGWLRAHGPASGVGGLSFYDIGALSGGSANATAFGFRAALEYTLSMYIPVFTGVAGAYLPQEWAALWDALNQWTVDQRHDASCSSTGLFINYWSFHIRPDPRPWIRIYDNDIPPNGGGTPTTPTPPRGQGLWIHKASNFAQGMFITIEAMTAVRLGLRTANPSNLIDVREERGFDIQSQLEIIDNALAHVTGERAHLGAKQNRLEYAAQNVTIAGENLSAANSRIRDTDMAREMMRLTMANVLQQAGISMLAQTQTTTERVLQLLQ